MSSEFKLGEYSLDETDPSSGFMKIELVK